MMKIKIQIKSRFFVNNVLFELETENNTVRETLLEAIKQGAYLQGADLRGENLQGAYLQGADLQGADLQDANLRGAYLQDAYLQGADLRGANLQDAYLQGADLQGADLQDANLRGANLQGADLRCAYLQGAYLQGAYLQGAYLQGADLRGAKDADYAIAMTRILPEGNIIGYKKCSDDKIVKLSIPAEAKRSHAFGRKCRAEYADVLEITKNGKSYKTAISQNDRDFKYKVGERVTPDSFDKNWTDECSNGIHFFITKLEAENY